MKPILQSTFFLIILILFSSKSLAVHGILEGHFIRGENDDKVDEIGLTLEFLETSAISLATSKTEYENAHDLDETSLRYMLYLDNHHTSVAISVLKDAVEREGQGIELSYQYNFKDLLNSSSLSTKLELRGKISEYKHDRNEAGVWLDYFYAENYSQQIWSLSLEQDITEDFGISVFGSIYKYENETTLTIQTKRERVISIIHLDITIGQTDQVIGINFWYYLKDFSFDFDISQTKFVETTDKDETIFLEIGYEWNKYISTSIKGQHSTLDDTNRGGLGLELYF